MNNVVPTSSRSLSRAVCSRPWRCGRRPVRSWSPLLVTSGLSKAPHLKVTISMCFLHPPAIAGQANCGATEAFGQPTFAPAKKRERKRDASLPCVSPRSALAMGHMNLALACCWADSMPKDPLAASPC